MRAKRILGTTGLVCLLAIPLAMAATRPAFASGVGSLPVSSTTTVGVHNTYDPATFTYLAQALDDGPGLIELDVWPDFFTHEWKVSHSNPLGNNNNCVAASTPAQLYTGGRNKNLEYCLDDIRVWSAAHPGSPPLIVKIEMKTGFSGRTGQGPAALDATIHAHLGDLVFTPAALLRKPDGSSYGSLDEAAQAGNWPTRDALAGKVIIEVIPGTVEESNPTDTLWTDVEYAQYLRGLATANQLSQAQIFPSVHNAATADPRTRYADAGLRPWFVVFDGDASAYVAGIDTSWYDARHYLLVMTDAQNVSPAVSCADPAGVLARIAALAAAHASVVSSDWATCPQVLSQALPRGSAVLP
jgi:hypothetical protein